MRKAVLVAFCVGLPVGSLATIPPSQRAWGAQRHVASGQSGTAHRKIEKKKIQFKLEDALSMYNRGERSKSSVSKKQNSRCRLCRNWGG
jgi:hypothetical protein